MSLFSAMSYTVSSPSQCFTNVRGMTGGIVSKSSSASGEVALEKLKRRRNVTMVGRSQGLRSDPASKDPLCLDTVRTLGEMKYQSEWGRELCLSKVSSRLQAAVLWG